MGKFKLYRRLNWKTLCAVTAIKIISLWAIAQWSSAASTVTSEQIDLYYQDMQQAASLTDNQVLEIKTLNKVYGDKFKQLSEEEVSRWKKIRKARSLNKEKQNQIKSLMSGEQFKQYLKYVDSAGKALLKDLKKQHDQAVPASS
ncbi:hypothetical protein R50073_34120 [Maricurvus nonylphenolicus]|uniref:hypothetical protein n=1 Tax=Maricurvus nonylphenolicus TaxID=1008307 RepID=UPI0036F22EDC